MFAFVEVEVCTSNRSEKKAVIPSRNPTNKVFLSANPKLVTEKKNKKHTEKSYFKPTFYLNIKKVSNNKLKPKLLATIKEKHYEQASNVKKKTYFPK